MYQLTERNREICELAKEGRSYASIGRKYGISRQRVFDIIKKHEANSLSTDGTIDT